MDTGQELCKGRPGRPGPGDTAPVSPLSPGLSPGDALMDFGAHTSNIVPADLESNTVYLMGGSGWALGHERKQSEFGSNSSLLCRGAACKHHQDAATSVSGFSARVLLPRS